MQTSVNLQPDFSYSIVPVIILVMALIISYIIYLKSKKKEEVVIEEVKVIPEKNIKNVPVIKGKYMDELASIEYKYSNKKIEIRKAYQLVSEAVRMFVFEMTDITTQNYSLAEIKKLNLPNLYELIEEYYEPEFASKSVGDFSSSIDKARRIINEWK